MTRRSACLGERSLSAILSLPSPIATETAEVAAHPWTTSQGGSHIRIYIVNDRTLWLPANRIRADFHRPSNFTPRQKRRQKTNQRLSSLGAPSFDCRKLTNINGHAVTLLAYFAKVQVRAPSPRQPFGLARASWHEHRPEGPGSLRQDHLVGHALIRAQRGLRREQIGSDVSVLVGRSGGRPSIVPVEDAEREQPQHGSGQRNGDSIAATLDRTPAQRREYADRAEPAHHVVDNGDDRRRFRTRERTFDGEQPRDGRADFIESRTILPGALGAVKQDTGMDQPRFPAAEFLGLETMAFQIARTLVREEDIGILQQEIEFCAILLRVIQDRRAH